MNGLTVTPTDIFEDILDLPQTSLADLAAYVEFLRFKAHAGDAAQGKMKGSPPAPPTEFTRAVAAFEQLKPQLLSQYGGRVVAVYQEQVVAVGDDRLAVFDEVVRKYGHVPCYIEGVEPVTPRRVRMPSTWVV